MSPRRLHRSFRPLLFFAALAALPASRAGAFGTADPFDTEAIAPPRPLLAPPAGSGFVPCRPLPAETVYGVLEVVDQALCRNPRTHEAWASARVEAAEVGVARAAYLPELNGSATVSHQRADGASANPRSASLTLAWLLYDSEIGRAHV